MFYDVKKGPLKSGEIFFKNLPNCFWKNAVAQWKRVGSNSNITGTGVKFCTKWQCSIILLHISNCVFSKTIWRKKHCSPMEKGQIEFLITSLEPRRNSVQNGNVQLFCYINSNYVFSKTIRKNIVAQWKRFGLYFW